MTTESGGADLESRMERYDFGRKVHPLITVLVIENFELKYPLLLRNSTVPFPPRQEFLDFADDALDSGRIDRSQYRSMLRTTDIILSAQDSSAQPVYLAVKITMQVRESDLIRAREGADALAAASGATALAVVIAPSIPPPQIRKARERDVHLIEFAGDDAD